MRATRVKLSGDNLQARFLAAIHHFRQVSRRLARQLLDLKQSQILSTQMDCRAAWFLGLTASTDNATFFVKMVTSQDATNSQSKTACGFSSQNRLKNIPDDKNG